MADRNDYVRLARNYISGHFAITLRLPSAGKPIENQILPLDVAQRAKLQKKCSNSVYTAVFGKLGNRGSRTGPSSTVRPASPLRPRHHRPRRRATKPCDERPTPHLHPPATHG